MIIIFTETFVIALLASSAYCVFPASPSFAHTPQPQPSALPNTGAIYGLPCTVLMSTIEVMLMI